jgi:hypothetical protein
MDNSDDPAIFYPDIAAQGSLGAALRAIADNEGLALLVATSEHNPLCRATVASPLPHRTELIISGWAWRRCWSIRGCESSQDLELIYGETQDLAAIVRAAYAWHVGEALADIRKVASFVHLTGRFEVPDQNPAQLIESEWQYLRTEAAERDWPEYHALIEAAYAEPALRQLYPFTSHWTLRFSTSTRPRLGTLAVCLDAHRDNRYTVSAPYLGDALAETTTAEAAVSVALRQLADHSTLGRDNPHPEQPGPGVH